MQRSNLLGLSTAWSGGGGGGGGKSFGTKGTWPIHLDLHYSPATVVIDFLLKRDRLARVAYCSRIRRSGFQPVPKHSVEYSCLYGRTKTSGQSFLFTDALRFFAVPPPCDGGWLLPLLSLFLILNDEGLPLALRSFNHGLPSFFKSKPPLASCNQRGHQRFPQAHYTLCAESAIS